MIQMIQVFPTKITKLLLTNAIKGSQKLHHKLVTLNQKLDLKITKKKELEIEEIETKGLKKNTKRRTKY